MKRIKTAICMLIAVLLVISSLPLHTLFASATSDDYIEYVDFGSSYSGLGWRYFTSGGSGKTSIENGMMKFASNTNSGNSFDDRAFLVTNARTTPKIESGKKYKVVFDVITPSSNFANLTSQIKFYQTGGLWSPVSGAPTVTDKLSTLKVESTSTSGSNTVYTLSQIITAPTLSSNCNLAMSVYGTGSGSVYYVDNVYVYAAKEYTITDNNGTELTKVYGFAGADIAADIEGSALDKFGYDFTVTPSTYPADNSEPIVITYAGKANLVCGIDFGATYAVGEKTDYVPESSGYVLLDGGMVKFNDTSAATVNFADRAILLANNAANSTVEEGGKYRVTLQLITWSNVADYTLELKYGSNLATATLDDTFVLSGDALKNAVKGQEALADGSTVYTVEFDVTAPTGFTANASRNMLVSLYGSTHIYLDSALISTFYTYEVEDTEGNSIGTIVGFPGDSVADAVANGNFAREDYKCTVESDEFFSEDSSAKVILKYTEITNVLQYIDFSATYAAGQRDAAGVPNWRYYTPGLVALSNEAITFKGSINSGKSYGDRSVLLANNRTVSLITANKRYELQFDLYLQGETLDTKTVQIQLGADVWSGANYKTAKASEYNLVSTRTEGIYTVYTLSTQIVSTANKNVLMSVYGNGNANDVLLDNVYIFEEYSYLCVDENGEEVGYLNAFPNEPLADLITGSAVDKLGYFEAPAVATAPLKSTQKIVIKYTEDPSFVQFIDFGSSYSGGAPGWRYYTSANVSYANQQMSFSKSLTSGKSYHDRAILLGNNFSKKLAEANKYYVIQFELWLKGDALSSKNVDIRIDDCVWGSSSPSAVYNAKADKYTLVKSRTVGEYTAYTLSVQVKATKNGNFLLSVYGDGTGNAAIVDNVEIYRLSQVALENTDMSSLMGKIGYDFALPTDILKKGYVFEGWYADAELTTKFTATKFANDDLVAYAKFTSVPTEAEMNFTLAPSASINMAGFNHNILGNIYASTKTAGTAYINMYTSGTAIRVSPANNYPVYFRYKTDNYSKDVTFGIATASKDNFDVANNVLATTTVKASNGWAEASLCATPDTLTKNGVVGDYLYFFVIFDSASKGKIYVDDIVLTQETSFTFVTNGGNAIADMKGEPGAAVTLPTPTNGTKTFSGWYYDAALTSKVESLNAIYPTAKCNITLYAGWDVADAPVNVEDFEAYNSSLIEDAANQRAKEVFTISNKFAYTGNTSLHYEYDPTASKLLSEKESTIKLTGNSGLSGNGIVIEKDKKYVMTLYVYAKTLNSRVDIQLATAGENNINTSYKLQTTAVGAARINNVFTPLNTWQKVEYVFTGATAADTANELFLSVRTITENYTELYIDNVSIKELTDDMGAVAFDDSMYRETLVDLEYKYVVGKVGEAIKFPEGARENYKLLSWHTEYRFLKLFSDVFEAGLKTAYPQWDIDGEVTVDFENTGHYSQDGVGSDKTWSYTLINGAKVVSGKQASSGNSAISINAANKGWRNDTKVIALKDVDASPFRLVTNTTYVISVDIYVEEYTGNFSFWFATGSQDNYYAWQGTTSGKMIVNEDVQTGKWITTTMTYSTAFSTAGGFNLFLCTTSASGMNVYFDNIKVESLDPDNITVIMNSGLVGGSAQRITGKLGDEYKLPTKLDIPGYAFVGWYNSPTLDKTVDFEDYFTTTRTVYAKLVPLTIKQDFESYHPNYNNLIGGDSEYETYGPTTDKYSAKNVHDGSYSLHRKGLSHQFKNAMLVAKSAQLSPGDVYEITMWVKMDKYDHTNGAIKIGSCSSSQFAWDLTDTMKAVVAIEDLTDGKWHKVTYKFMASAYYLAIQTPGYCSIYIDDISIKYVGAGVPSEEVIYTEYVPVKKDANGVIPEVTPEISETIADSNLEVYERLNTLIDQYGDYSESVTKIKKKSTSISRERIPLTFMDIVTGNTYVLYTVAFYVGVAAVVLIGAGVTLLIVFKKRKRRISK